MRGEGNEQVMCLCPVPFTEVISEWDRSSAESEELSRSSRSPTVALGDPVLVPLSAQAAITKHHRLGNLNNRYLFSQFWRLGS